MKISVIICEYNPLHAGHVYQIDKTRELTGCDKVIAVMSGSFTQRGEPAVYDKFKRTKAALLNGIDMVVELPSLFSSATAEKFAYGGVFTANSLGVCDYLSFGAENAELSALYKIASFLTNEPAEYKEALKAGLKNKLSYPSARRDALLSYFPGYEELISSPNNILAIEYLKALIRLKSDITPIAIERKGSSYHERVINDVPSATAIREALKRNEDISGFSKVPPGGEVLSESLFLPLIIKLRASSPEELKNIEGISEGLEFSVIKAARTAKSYEELIELIKSKRYARTRVSRILLNILLDIKKGAPAAPEYIRVLGIKKNSKELLSLMAKNASLPVITSPAAFNNKELKRDILATDLRAALEKPAGEAFKDFSTPLITI